MHPEIKLRFCCVTYPLKSIAKTANEFFHWDKDTNPFCHCEERSNRTPKQQVCIVRSDSYRDFVPRNGILFSIIAAQTPFTHGS